MLALTDTRTAQAAGIQVVGAIEKLTAPFKVVLQLLAMLFCCNTTFLTCLAQSAPIAASI